MRRASSGTWNGEPYVVDEWTTEVFVRRDGQWVCALSHKTQVAEG
jgi:hypothetical protein